MPLSGQKRGQGPVVAVGGGLAYSTFHPFPDMILVFLPPWNDRAMYAFLAAWVLMKRHLVREALLPPDAPNIFKCFPNVPGP